MHPLLLNRCAEVVAEPLALIFQKSFDTGQVPADWKSANVAPIFKKGSRTEPGNYRPVSLTSVPSKIMESIIRDDTLSFLESSNKLNSYQHGFTRKRSCLTNLLESLEAWTHALDDGYGVDVIFLDYRKAFDSVPHKRLQEKLKLFGLNAKLVAWITEFLKNRRMRVRVHGSFSNWAEVFSGVPQGSVLGPLLFLLFVNDLPSVIRSHIRMFADDTKIWCTIKEEIDNIGLQQDLDSMDSWCHEWLLKLNPDKCKVMHIGHRMKTVYYVTEEGVTRQLDETTDEKDLGIYLLTYLYL